MRFQQVRYCVYLLLIMSLFSVGCAAIKAYPDRSVEIEQQLRSLTWCFDADRVRKPDSGWGPTAWRNEVVNCRVHAIDLQFTLFEQSLAREGVLLNTSADIAVVGLGAATALVTGSAAKSILGAVSGGITGTKGIIDKDVFYSKTMPALLTQMEAHRKTQLVKIRTRLQSPADKYPLSEALIDVEEYYKAGSIPAALQAIIEQSGATAKEATETLKRLQPASEREVAQITDVRTRFNALFNAWKSAPQSDAGKKALTEASAILKKLQPDTTATDQAVFEALDGEIQRADPGGEPFKRVTDAFSPR